MRSSLLLALVLFGSSLTSTPARALAQRAQPQPLTDMALGETYAGFEGGLYAGSLNAAPASHAEAGVLAASRIQPLDAFGTPDATGHIGLLSISMSNATQEFCHGRSSGGEGQQPCEPWSFMGQASADPMISHTGNGGPLVIANGARGGQALQEWDEATDLNYDRVETQVLPGFGLTESQIQIVWVKAALKAEPSRPSLPDPGADAFVLEVTIGNVVRALKTRYPNLQQVFLTSRIYGGYASMESNSPEPWAYETGFGVKWAIDAQIQQRQTGVVDSETGDVLSGEMPFMDWGPYLWASGEVPRVDGLVWPLDHFQSDGMHPNERGETVVAEALLGFFKTSSVTACWFALEGTCGDTKPSSTDVLVLAPEEMPVAIPSTGGVVTGTALATNPTEKPVAASLAFTLTLPDGRVRSAGPTHTLALAPGEEVAVGFSQRITQRWADGSYTYAAQLSGDLNAEASFVFEKGSTAAVSANASRVEAALPGSSRVLSEVSPNPFRSQARFTVRVAESQQVLIDVYDALGRRVVRLHQDDLTPGMPHSFDFDARALPSGVYVIRVVSKTFVSTQRVTRLR